MIPGVPGGTILLLTGFIPGSPSVIRPWKNEIYNTDAAAGPVLMILPERAAVH